jgi:hypothetical protein
MWGSKIKSFSPWAAEIVRLGWRTWRSPFKGCVGFTALAVPPSVTGIPPNASAGRRWLSTGHHKTMDHIPVLNCRMQDVEEGGIGSLLAFFSYTACPTMHGISFTQSIAFRVLRTRAFLLSPRRHQWTLRVNLSVLSWYRASSRL